MFLILFLLGFHRSYQSNVARVQGNGLTNKKVQDSLKLLLQQLCFPPFTLMFAAVLSKRSENCLAVLKGTPCTTVDNEFQTCKTNASNTSAVVLI